MLSHSRQSVKEKLLLQAKPLGCERFAFQHDFILAAHLAVYGGRGRGKCPSSVFERKGSVDWACSLDASEGLLGLCHV